jgi:hypothetical protein
MTETTDLRALNVGLADQVAQPREAIPQMAAKIRNHFPPSVKKGKYFDAPDGIIAHLTRECGGNVHDRHVVEVTCGSFEDEPQGANPHSGAYNNEDLAAAKNAADLEAGSLFYSAYRLSPEDIPHTRNN